MPVVEQDRKHLKLLKPRNLGLALLGVSVLGAGLVAAVGLGLIGHKKPTPRTSIIYAGPLTAAQLRAAKNAVRADGTISSLTATEITMTLTGQTGPVTLKLTDKTKYMHGKRGATADKSTLIAGQKSVAAYDSVTRVATSVWGGYDE